METHFMEITTWKQWKKWVPCLWGWWGQISINHPQVFSILVCSEMLLHINHTWYDKGYQDCIYNPWVLCVSLKQWQASVPQGILNLVLKKWDWFETKLCQLPEVKWSKQYEEIFDQEISETMSDPRTNCPEDAVHFSKHSKDKCLHEPEQICLGYICPLLSYWLWLTIHMNKLSYKWDKLRKCHNSILSCLNWEWAWRYLILCERTRKWAIYVEVTSIREGKKWTWW